MITINQAANPEDLAVTIDTILKSVGVGYRRLDDPFFQNSYDTCKVFQRLGVTADIDEELCHDIIQEFACYATGCSAVFRTLVDFEIHYNSKHRYVCSECKKILPSPRILDIHIQESHDSFFEILSLKQSMYQCFDSECELRFDDAKARRQHCVEAHRFPKHFRFDESRYSKKDEQSNKMDCDEVEGSTKPTKPKKVQLNKNQRLKMFPNAAKTVPVNTNTSVTSNLNQQPKSTVSALSFIPRQVQKSYAKALTKNESGEQNVLETETLMDLAESLPN